MEIRLSKPVEKIVQRLVAEGQFRSPEDAVNTLLLRGIQERPTLPPATASEPEGRTSETPFEKASRLGLIGAARGLPPDLSRHERHMEGFGRS